MLESKNSDAVEIGIILKNSINTFASFWLIHAIAKDKIISREQVLDVTKSVSSTATRNGDAA